MTAKNIKICSCTNKYVRIVQDRYLSKYRSPYTINELTAFLCVCNRIKNWQYFLRGVELTLFIGNGLVIVFPLMKKINILTASIPCNIETCDICVKNWQHFESVTITFVEFLWNDSFCIQNKFKQIFLLNFHIFKPLYVLCSSLAPIKGFVARFHRQHHCSQHHI